VLPKPSGCAGCQLWQDGRGWVPDEIRDDALVQVVAQAPGSHEELGERVIKKLARREYLTEPCQPAPLIGPTGYELMTRYLPEAGLTREQISLSNVLKCRLIVNGKRTNDMPTGKVYTQAVAHCMAAHFRVGRATRLLVAMGQHGWRALGGPGTISEWRGFLAPVQYDPRL
jgi:uracil-DNA glycosylase